MRLGLLEPAPSYCTRTTNLFFRTFGEHSVIYGRTETTFLSLYLILSHD